MPNDATLKAQINLASVTEAQKSNHEFKSYLLSSVTTGMINSALFNPIDRALYLAIINKRPFLSKANFAAPFQGYIQVMTQKCIFGSTYYILQNEMRKHLYPYLRHDLKLDELSASLSIGLTAGALNGILSNPMSAIKYQTWRHDEHKYLQTTLAMWKGGKFTSFIRGTRVTIYRDMTFGSVYEVLRAALSTQFNKQNNKDPTNSTKLMTIDFVCDALSAVCATISASAFQYVRNMQYGTPPHEKAPTIKEALKALHQEIPTQSNTFLGKTGFFAKQFQLGWGTARTGVGMAVGQIIFDKSYEAFTNYFSTQNAPKR